MVRHCAWFLSHSVSLGRASVVPARGGTRCRARRGRRHVPLSSRGVVERRAAEGVRLAPSMLAMRQHAKEVFSLGLSIDRSDTRTFIHTIAPPPLPGDASPWSPIARADSHSIASDLRARPPAPRRSRPRWTAAELTLAITATAARVAVATTRGTRRAWARTVLSPLDGGRPPGCSHSSGCWIVAISSLDPCRSWTAQIPTSAFPREGGERSERREGHGWAMPSRGS